VAEHPILSIFMGADQAFAEETADGQNGSRFFCLRRPQATPRPPPANRVNNLEK
jgi:hypothetical protein